MTAPNTSPAAADPLAGLRGIHLPDPVGFWPPAPGWWGLLAFLVLAAVGTTVVVRRRRRSLGRNALRELDGIARRHTGTTELSALATALSEILRRVALVRFGRRVASLHGAAWQAFLDEQVPPSRRAARQFDAGVARVLAIAPYAPPMALATASGELSSVDRDRLLAATRAWIRWNT